MNDFQILPKEEYDLVWERFCQLFDFKPSVSKFPAIHTSRPQLKLSISSCFSHDFPYADFEQLGLTLLKNISEPGDRLYTLDWQHDCYDFDPRQDCERDEFEEWPIPVLPNGDYCIFLTKDFENVWFGHPWDQTITLIGKDIVQQAQILKAEFDKLLKH